MGSTERKCGGGCQKSASVQNDVNYVQSMYVRKISENLGISGHLCNEFTFKIIPVSRYDGKIKQIRKIIAENCLTHFCRSADTSLPENKFIKRRADLG